MTGASVLQYNHWGENHPNGCVVKTVYKSIPNDLMIYQKYIWVLQGTRLLPQYIPIPV